MNSPRDLEGKLAIVTGANTGIGRVTAETLAARGAHVVLACRSLEKTRPVLDAIASRGGSAEFLELDLADLDATRAAAERFLATARPLHLLIANAGLAGQRGLTAQGFELTFGVNHLGHFVFVETLLPKLRESAPARIVLVSSEAHRRAKRIDWDALRRPTANVTGLPEYAVSKLCNALYARELSARLAGTQVTTYALHPGVVASDVWRSIPAPVAWLMKRFMITNEQGAATTLHCATEPSLARESGLFYEKCARRDASRTAQDDALAEELVRRSREFVGDRLGA